MADYPGEGRFTRIYQAFRNSRPNGGRPLLPPVGAPKRPASFYVPYRGTQIPYVSMPQFERQLEIQRLAAAMRPRALYRPSRGATPTAGGGGGGGGGGGAAGLLPGGRYEQFGISPQWMKAYKEFWGAPLPERLWGLFNPIVSLFSRYMGRLPQIEDWRAIWQAAKDYYTSLGVPAAQAKHMPQQLEVYEPFIAAMVRQPLFTPPAVSYAPNLSF